MMTNLYFYYNLDNSLMPNIKEPREDHLLLM